MDYNTVDNFSFYIFLIDPELNIVKSSSLGRVVFSTQEDRGAVKLNVESIENITGMAFSYSGRIRAGNGVFDLFKSPF